MYTLGLTLGANRDNLFSWIFDFFLISTSAMTCDSPVHSLVFSNYIFLQFPTHWLLGECVIFMFFFAVAAIAAASKCDTFKCGWHLTIVFLNSNLRWWKLIHGVDNF